MTKSTALERAEGILQRLTTFVRVGRVLDLDFPAGEAHAMAVAAVHALLALGRFLVLAITDIGQNVLYLFDIIGQIVLYIG